MLYYLEVVLWTSVQGVILAEKSPESSRYGTTVVGSRARRIEKKIGFQRICNVLLSRFYCFWPSAGPGP